MPISEYERIVTKIEKQGDAEPGSAEAGELKKIARLVIGVELGQLVHVSSKSRAYSTLRASRK